MILGCMVMFGGSGILIGLESYVSTCFRTPTAGGGGKW